MKSKPQRKTRKQYDSKAVSAKTTPPVPALTTDGTGTERLNSPRGGMKTRTQVKVWDVLVRVFHWSLVTSFATGYLITDQFPLHAYAGYVIFTLVALRIVWGFVGTPYARFSAFTFTVKETIQYALAALRMGEAREYLSHNPMGAIMVFAIMFLLLSNTIVGMMLYGAQQLDGPLAEIVPLHWDETLETAHFLMARALLVLAGFHVLGVLWASWWHRQNYVLAMFTGYKSVFTRRSHREGDRRLWTEKERVQHRRQP